MSKKREQVPAAWFVILVSIAVLELGAIVFLANSYLHFTSKPRTLEVFIYGWCTDMFTGDPVENATIGAFLDWEGDWKYTDPSRATTSWENGFYVLTFRIYEDITNEDFEIYASHKEAYGLDPIRIYHLTNLYEIGWGSIVWRQDFRFVTADAALLIETNQTQSKDQWIFFSNQSIAKPTNRSTEPTRPIRLGLLDTLGVGARELSFHGFRTTGDPLIRRRYDLVFGVLEYGKYAGELYVPLVVGQTFTVDYERREITSEGDVFVYLEEAKFEIVAFNIGETWIELRRVQT